MDKAVGDRRHCSMIFLPFMKCATCYEAQFGRVWIRFLRPAFWKSGWKRLLRIDITQPGPDYSPYPSPTFDEQVLSLSKTGHLCKQKGRIL
jgi:hypothetical protein